MPRILLLAVLATLTACTSLRPPETPAPVETREVPRSAPPSTSGANTPGERPVVGPPVPDFEPRSSVPLPPERPGATASLLAQADAAVAAGELDRAAALAERALRITPRDAPTWYTLANIQLHQRRYADAEGSAERALSFAGGNAPLVRRINALLGTIRNSR